LAVYETYSKRKKRLSGDTPDVYQYDYLHQTFKVQVVHIWDEAIGHRDEYSNESMQAVYTHVKDILCKELGSFNLPYFSFRDGPAQEVTRYFLEDGRLDHNLDVLELMFQVLDIPSVCKDNKAKQAIEDLNIRFKEHATGYQFISNELIRTDSQILHSEAVVPALRLLNQNGYEGAEREFLNAHEAYRHGDIINAITECHKSFESTMRSIIHKRGWKYDCNDNATEKSEDKAKTKANASRLIQICFENNLLPEHFNSQITSLRTLLESSIPTIRNKNGSHGDGIEIKKIPASLASYMLHITASTILFLIQLEDHHNEA
jgi:hypothetical protein